ncbi:porin family protein [Aestuariibaculum sediminum]|uniref:PorT family protein n=1 Tax=Aestuariibaculum sediminum TaxID=2770637 RepID=A0A8J6U866_9FLAO|nr:porin family protein [Aestuariibaculum sediminum]MBD0830957.1 PorT family protein [Aestuariibaculum sediminum]
MKNNILILAFVAITGFFSKTEAQNYRFNNPYNFGIKAGLNVSSFQGRQDGISRNSLLGYHVGLVAENRINRGFAIQPEFLYSRVGAEESYSDGVQGRYFLDYISVPVMAKLYLGDQFSLDFGPQLGFLVRDIARYSDDYYDYDAGANTFDFAFNFGLSMQLDRYWFAQVRYSVGVTTVLENPDVQNGVFQLSVGHRF